LGLNPADFKYANSDPGTAAQSLQLGQAQAVQIWNPYVLQTLRKNPKAKVLFDSKQISSEIIDMIVVANDSLAKDGGKRFAQALIDTYYQLNLLLNGSAMEDTLVAIGHKFSSLNAADMDIVCTQTKFFGTPTESLRVFDKTKLVPVMKRVEKFCLESQMVKKLPTIGYDDPKAQMNFSTSYIQDVVKAASAATN
jgi:NitT/TauT family transport system substrate-binding protein